MRVVKKITDLIELARRARRKGKPVVLKFVPRQTGGVKSISRDKARRALPPGKRRSKSGKIYYEYRKNRSDMPGRNV